MIAPRRFFPPAGLSLDREAHVRRARRAESVVDLIGNTPIVRLRNLEPRDGIELWAKCEFLNPGGSVKDRPARQMVQDALADGRLQRGQTLLDATSGNTGVALSMVGAALGFPVTLVMPENVTAARKQIISAYGTELLYSSGMEGSDGAIRKVRDVVAASPERYFYCNQYGNESNPRAHYLTTGVEILDAVGDRLTHFVTGIGTSGTVMGTGRRLKQDKPSVTVVAAEPDDEFHGLEGLKHMASSIVPPIYRPQETVDRILPIGTELGWETAERLAAVEGLFVGHSAGANVAAALQLAAELPDHQAACLVTILCDRGDRYFVPLKWEKHYEW